MDDRLKNLLGKIPQATGGEIVSKTYSLLQKSINKSDMTIEGYVSTINVDRDGKIILPVAFSSTMGSFMTNPVILQMHDGLKLPVGKIVSYKVDDYGLYVKIQFAGTETGKEFFYLYSEGFMNAFSVGFAPVKYLDIVALSPENVGVFANNGIDVSNVSRIYVEVELIEISCVPVPLCKIASQEYGKNNMLQEKIK